MSTIAIIQARMGSTRLPGKVLKDLAGRSVLATVISRVKCASLVDMVVIATTKKAIDDPIVHECQSLDIDVFRGDEGDVLDRYYRAALWKEATSIVRITADCPLIDAGVIDETIAVFLKERPDYASNTLERSYPRGLDTEVFSFAALEQAWKDAKQSYERAHVTPYFYQNPQLFRMASIKTQNDYSAYRWTLDTPEDLHFLREVCGRFQKNQNPDWQDVVALLKHEPALLEINAKISQKTLHEE